MIAFATAPETVALDGTGANSPFSAALVRYLGTPSLEVDQMFPLVRADVVASTGNRRGGWSPSSRPRSMYLGGRK